MQGETVPLSGALLGVDMKLEVLAIFVNGATCERGRLSVSRLWVRLSVSVFVSVALG
jgi:hypothetical protein